MMKRTIATTQPIVQIGGEAPTRIYGHKSHPFPVKTGQKIAVRVISQFGEETTKVLEAK